ncbi:MAG TPA: hypothetical protein VF665_20400 [Longimicrobium sp.]|jgi:hypothetical protein|uniref:hypothetical protein n=1 Tax=Longimicrobium sp. TaxID=2029185 RepID=UPI002ED9D2FC
MLKVETKSAIILLATLLLGAAMGALGTGALARYRAAQVEQMRRNGGFPEHMREIIQPRSAAQWDSLLPIVRATGRRNERIQARTRREMRAALDSMRAELAPRLDADQRRRLDQFARGAFRPRRPAPPPRGPYPPMGPPPPPPGAHLP